MVRRRGCLKQAVGDSEGVLDSTSPPKQVAPTTAFQQLPLPATAAPHNSAAAAEASETEAQPASQNSIRTLNADIAEIAIPTLIALAADPIAGMRNPPMLSCVHHVAWG